MDNGDRFDKLINALYSQMSLRIESTATKLRNERAPGKKPMPQAEQLNQYLQMRQDPAAWQSIVAEQGVKNTIKYYQTMEKRAEKEFERLNKEYGGLGSYRNLPIPQAIVDGVIQISQTMTGSQQNAQPPDGGGAPTGQPTPPEQAGPPPELGGGAPPGPELGGF